MSLWDSLSEGIVRFLRGLVTSRYVVIDYETLCADTTATLAQIAKMVDSVGGTLTPRDDDVTALVCTNKKIVDDEDYRRLEDACQVYFGPPDAA